LPALNKDPDKISPAGKNARRGSVKMPALKRDLVELLNQESVLDYLAHMLSSFTRINSYTISVRIGKGIWKKIRFNDLDIQSLKNFCGSVEDEYRRQYLFS
jgi:hypothetical protein